MKTDFHSLRRTPIATFALMGVLLIAGCGGGGDAIDAASTPEQLPTQVASPNQVLSNCGLADFDSDLLDAINKVRASGASCGTSGTFGATTPVVWNNALMAAADGHSTDMAAQNYVSHTSADGRTVADRLAGVGYQWRAYGENIAAGQPTVAVVMAGWQASPGHCANLMNPLVADVGVACASASDSANYDTYWTMELGRQFTP